MIVITGAEGFIGSCLVKTLNDAGYNDLVLVDDFGQWPNRALNLQGKVYAQKIERSECMPWLQANASEVEFVFHIGARTDTTEKDPEPFRILNYEFSVNLFEICIQEGLPIVYASSAATYGDGAFGYSDDESVIEKLHPMNPYGQSKHDFDVYALKSKRQPFFWAGLKFFNVYGPNEYHKNRMASVVYHAFGQIKKDHHMKLFRSHRPDFADGEQMRDFIYVKDLCSVCLWLMHHRKHSGIYNLGSGLARTWNDLIGNVFDAMQLPRSISYIDIPEDIRDSYQYYTCADMHKLHAIGYSKPFYTLEEGVLDYVQNYLIPGKIY